MPGSQLTPQKDYLITDSTDIAVAVEAAGTQSNFGAAFSAYIPPNGVIRFASLSARILGSGGKVSTSFGIRIGATNYWFDEVLIGGVSNYGGMFFCSNGGTLDYYGLAACPESSGVAGAIYPSVSSLDVTGKGIPSGIQNIQLIAGRSGVGSSTIKGTVRQSRAFIRIDG